jgi:hypothetical protein
MIKRTLAKSALRSQWDFEVAQEICARNDATTPNCPHCDQPGGIVEVLGARFHESCALQFLEEYTAAFWEV